MRPQLALFVLPVALLLAACEQNQTTPSAPTAPQTQTPAPQPAADQPALPPSDDLDLAPVTGTWAASDCAAPITITPTSFEAPGKSCQITSITGTADGALTTLMSCQGTGEETVTMTPIFAPSGEGIRLDYAGGGTTDTVFRCGR